jgi:hypothetical protein
MGGRGVSGGNYYDLETGEEFWVSGVKKDGRDRHWAGNGKILVEAAALAEYLEVVGANALDGSSHEVTYSVVETDITKFERMENTSR